MRESIFTYRADILFLLTGLLALSPLLVICHDEIIKIYEISPIVFCIVGALFILISYAIGHAIIGYLCIVVLSSIILFAVIKVYYKRRKRKKKENDN